MKKHYPLKGVVLALMSGMICATSSAQSIWSGNAEDNLWTTPENWQSGTAPESSSTTDVQISGNSNLDITVNDNIVLRSLQFNAGTGSSTLNGSQIGIYGKGNDSTGAVINNSVNLQTINSNIVISGQTAFLNAGGGLTLNGSITTYANIGFINYNNDPASSIVVNGAISGAGSVNFNGNADAIVRVNGTSSYTGSTNIRNSTVIIGSDVHSGQNGAFGNSTNEIRMGSGSGSFTPSLLTDGARNFGRIVRIVSPASSTTNAKIGGYSGHTSTFSEAIILGSDNAAAQSLHLTAASNGRVNITGNLTRASGATGNGDAITVSGQGIVAIEGNNNTYSGTTTVTEGVLLINGVLTAGGGSVIAKAGSTLGGEGELHRDLLIESGATFSVGDYDATNVSTAGELNVTGNVSFSDGSILVFDLGDISDNVSITGDLLVNGTLSINAGIGFRAGSYQLFNYTGNFTDNGLAIGSIAPEGFELRLDTSVAGEVILIVSAIPEPATWAAITTALVIGAASLRKRKKTTPSKT